MTYGDPINPQEARLHMLAWVQVIKYHAYELGQSYNKLQTAVEGYTRNTPGLKMLEFGHALSAFASVCGGAFADTLKAHDLGRAALDAKDLEVQDDEIREAYMLAVSWGVPKGHPSLFR